MMPTEPGLILPLLKAQSFLFLEKMQRHPFDYFTKNKGNFWRVYLVQTPVCVCKCEYVTANVLRMFLSQTLK